MKKLSKDYGAKSDEDTADISLTCAILIILAAFCLVKLLTGCANPIATKIERRSPDGARFLLELPKEIEAKNLRVELDPETGKAILEADWLSSRNEKTIKAQAQREKVLGEAIGNVTGTAAGAAARAAIGMP